MMIDWWNVFTHSLWIVGLAAALAILGHTDWQASEENKGIRTTIRHISEKPGFALALALICLGAGLGVIRSWERLLWLVLAASAFSLAVWLWFSQRQRAAA